MAGWEHWAAIRPCSPQPTLESVRGGQEPGEFAGFWWTKHPFTEEKEKKDFQK